MKPSTQVRKLQLVHLAVSEVATDARNLYERLGFQEWGREPRASVQTADLQMSRTWSWTCAIASDHGPAG